MELTYGFYNSTLNEGQRVRRMRRTELSFDKICYINSPRLSYFPSPVRYNHNQFSLRRIASVPKLEPFRKSKNKVEKSRIKAQFYRTENQYYNRAHPVNKQGIQQKIILPTNSSSHKNTPINHLKQTNGSKLASNRSSHLSRKSGRLQNIKSKNSYLQQKNLQDYKNMPSACSNKAKHNKQESKQEDVYELRKQYSKISNKAIKNKIQKKKSHISHQMSRISHNSVSRNSKKLKESSKKNQKNQLNSSSSQYMLKSSMLNSEMDMSDMKKISQNAKINDQIIHSSNLKSENWNDAMKSIEVNEHLKSSIKQKKSIIRTENLKERISLKIDSVRSDNNVYMQGSKAQLKNSIKNLPLASKDFNSRMNEQVSQLPCQDNIQDVLERITLYDNLLDLIPELNQKLKYMRESTSEQIQIVCFLLEKKYLYEKSNLFKCLTGIGKNIFTLKSIEIPEDILRKYLEHEDVKKFVQQLRKTNTQLSKNTTKKAKQLKSKYGSIDIFEPLIPNDSFTSELVLRMYDELDQVYSQLQNMEDENLGEAEDLIIEIMELIFFFSELRGRKVKAFQFPDYVQDFEGYIDLNMPLLEESIKFFEQ